MGLDTTEDHCTTLTYLLYLFGFYVVGTLKVRGGWRL
jgi:hypothetical protein